MNIRNMFPSFDYIVKKIIATFVRFPLTLICVIIATAAAVWLGENLRLDATDYILEKILVTSYLGLPLFLSFVLFAEKRKWSKSKVWGLQLFGIVLLVSYFLSLPENIEISHMHMLRFFLLGIGLHFLVAWLPFAGSKEIDGFWEFNKTIFLRFLLAILYSAVLYAGLTIALAAADHLFGMHIKEERYFQLWVIVAGLVNSWIFLAGVPKDLLKLESSTTYPKGLQVFTQFILLPLVGLYFVILIAYEAKIVIEWNWPKGWVSQLVLWYAVVGILSLLLLYPLRKLEENKWVKTFLRWFFFGVVPLAAMLFLAIIRRISDYGITEPRYLVLAMSIGLVIVTVYFIFSKRKDIKLIPLVLCYIAFISAYGPGSAFTISKGSQINRLNKYLEQESMLVDGKIQNPEKQPDFETRKEMSSIISYLKSWHGMDSFKNWFDDSTLMTIDSNPQFTKITDITALFGFEYVMSWEFQDSNSIKIVRNDTLLFSSKDYDYLYIYHSMYDLDSVFIFDNNRLLVFTNYTDDQLTFLINDDTLGVLPLSSICEHLVALQEAKIYSDDSLSFFISHGGFDGKCVFTSIAGTRTDSLIDIWSIDFLLMIRHTQSQ